MPAARQFRGAFTALITPFREDGSIDQDAFRSLVRRQIDGCIHGLVPCGTTGETPTLSHEEDEWVIGTTLEIAGERPSRGRLRVIAGTGSNSTQTAINSTRRAAALGVDAALVVAPYYNKPDQRMMEAHFRAIADEGDLPIIVYNIPGRTGVNIEAATLLRLAEHPRIVAVKEASANMDQIQTILRERPADFSILSGDDNWTLPLLAMGADGVISDDVERDSGPDGGNVRRRVRRRLGPGATAPRTLAAAHAGQLRRRPEPEPGQDRDVADGTLRRHDADAAPAARRAVPRPDADAPRDARAGRRRRCRGRSPNGGAHGGHPRRRRVSAQPELDPEATAEAILRALDSGAIRTAEPDADAPNGWRVNSAVQSAILRLFANRETRTWDLDGLQFRDRVGLPTKDLLHSAEAEAALAAGKPWRVVPGGTSVRAGVYLAPGVTVMPPSYINVGAWIGEGTMVDSHVLVGSCAQIGARVHLSAAVQIGGVLEPPGRRPVIVEDEAFVGAQAALLEGVLVRRGAVIAAGRDPHRNQPSLRSRRGAGHRRHARRAARRARRSGGRSGLAAGGRRFRRETRPFAGNGYRGEVPRRTHRCTGRPPRGTAMKLPPTPPR